jgi:hypothetical protein
VILLDANLPVHAHVTLFAQHEKARFRVDPLIDPAALS